MPQIPTTVVQKSYGKKVNVRKQLIVIFKSKEAAQGRFIKTVKLQSKTPKFRWLFLLLWKHYGWRKYSDFILVFISLFLSAIYFFSPCSYNGTTNVNIILDIGSIYIWKWMEHFQSRRQLENWWSPCYPRIPPRTLVWRAIRNWI